MEPVGLNLIKSTAPFELPPLPYSYTALSPSISEKTLSFHHDKHHRKYVTTTNELIKGTQYEKSTLEQIIKGTNGNAEMQKLFNNASQAWNHWFYWNSLKPGGGKTPEGKIRQIIDNSFGSYDTFVKEFSSIAIEQFGSGYAWIVKDGERLRAIKTSNAENPIAMNIMPVLALDVWEHSYYLDYQNKRQDYVMAVISNCLNWEFAEMNYLS
ncbi:MAG: superoxide dismutase [Fibrobacter sp.]|nr:superoxide dismutase [Fibrobacter sp.]